MATTLVSVETREVVRCEYCRLMQYQNQQLPLQKVPQAPRYRGASAFGSATGDEPARAGIGRGRIAGGRTGAGDAPRAPPEPAPTGGAHAGAAHLHLQNRKRQGDSHAGLAGAAGHGARRGNAPTGARFPQPPRRRSGSDSEPIRSWPRLPLCCRIWTRCTGRCSTARCGIRPWAAGAPRRALLPTLAHGAGVSRGALPRSGGRRWGSCGLCFTVREAPGHCGTPAQRCAGPALQDSRMCYGRCVTPRIRPLTVAFRPEIRLRDERPFAPDRA